MTDIPEDVMEAARSAILTSGLSYAISSDCAVLMRHIARAIMAERERLTGSAELNGTFRHVKTGGLYHIALLCRIEATNTPAVAYVSHKDGTVWVRPQDEFLDGRFEKVEGAAKP